MKYIIISIIFIFTSCTQNKQVLNKQCYELPKVGNCKAMFQRYYYNQKSSSCKQFYWGGCAGNVPFKSIESCKNTCEQ